MRRDWKRSKKVFWGGYRVFFCTKDKVRGQERESECSEREREREKPRKREGLQSWSGQRLPGTEEFMVDLSLFATGLQ